MIHRSYVLPAHTHLSRKYYILTKFKSNSSFPLGEWCNNILQTLLMFCYIHVLYNTLKTCCVRAPMGAQHAESPYCCNSTILSSAYEYDVTITLRCVLVWICAVLSHTDIVLWIKYALRFDRALAIFSQEEEKEWNFTHPRYEILINLIKFCWYSRCCTTQMANGFDLCNGTIFRMRWKIDVLFKIYAKSRTIARSTISHLYTV